jgi:CheY-like chemotaxis protein
MAKKVLDVGQCDYDHGNIKNLIESNFDASVDRSHMFEDTLDKLRLNAYDLVLINRLLDQDHSEGLELLKQIKADAELSSVHVMMITNFEEHQETAIAAGAVAGFGKAQYDEPGTLQNLKSALQA